MYQLTIIYVKSVITWPRGVDFSWLGSTLRTQEAAHSNMMYILAFDHIKVNCGNTPTSSFYNYWGSQPLNDHIFIVSIENVIGINTT